VNKPIRTVSVFCLLLFLALMVNATVLQFFSAQGLDDDPRNRRVTEASFSRERGAILVDREPVAESSPSDDEYEYQRRYPSPLLYAPLTGYFAYSIASTGVERSENDVLSGDDPRLFVPRLVDLFSNEDTQGGSVELTIDPAAQQAAYDGLKALGPDVQGAVVALDPGTGAIRAMVSLPSYDPNQLASHDFDSVNRRYQELARDDTDPLINRAIDRRLFPGSTFKVVTAAAALENGIVDGPDDLVPGGDTFDVPQSTQVVQNEGRDCGSGDIPLRQAMENSCNTSFAALAGEVGEEDMLEQAEKFGFNSDDLDDIGPSTASVFPDDADPAQVTQTGFGQFEVQATPLQMAMVAGGIANDGVVMKPYVVDQIQSADYDAEETDPQRLSTAISSDTAETLTDVMVTTVSEGTASPAAIPGVNVAGKTGTAERGIEGEPPYGWFISFAPAEEPEVAVAVMIEEAPGQTIAGGQLGGPIAKRVMEAMLR